ncbi:MAG TPA: hypothetical protein VIU87_16875 [Mycobacterium sp.]
MPHRPGSIRDEAARTGVSFSSIQRQRAAAAAGPGVRPNQTDTTDRDTRILAAWRRGMTCRAIAADVGCSKSTVAAITGPARAARRRADAAELDALTEQLLTLTIDQGGLNRLWQLRRH